MLYRPIARSNNTTPRFKLNTVTKFKISLIGVIALAGVTASLVIQHQAQVELSKKDEVLRQRNSQLASMSAEHQRLSHLVVQANNPPTNDPMSELQKLRTQAESLRKQTNELGKQLAENRRSRRSQAAVKVDPHPPEYWEQFHQRVRGKSTDARNLVMAFRRYAEDHQNHVPSDFTQVAPYLSEGLSLTGTNKFEIVYQGSFEELKNIPLREVVVIRDRQGWLAPSGKWAKVYGLADGSARIVESDDNFQSWEAEHIIPPPAAGQQ